LNRPIGRVLPYRDHTSFSWIELLNFFEFFSSAFGIGVQFELEIVRLNIDISRADLAYFVWRGLAIR
jgi:hypothetical protein